MEAIGILIVKAICKSNSLNRIDPEGLKDYIYTSKDEYYIENDWGIFDFLHKDNYFAKIGETIYKANSQETVELYDWKTVDINFLNKTLDKLVDEANRKDTTFSRIMNESINGELDFKLSMPETELYLANGILYNRNEAGNFVWSYFLKSHGYGEIISGILAQGGSIVGSKRLDESWDRRARWAGINYYKERKNNLQQSIIDYYEKNKEGAMCDGIAY